MRDQETFIADEPRRAPANTIQGLKISEGIGALTEGIAPVVPSNRRKARLYCNQLQPSPPTSKARKASD